MTNYKEIQIELPKPVLEPIPAPKKEVKPKERIFEVDFDINKDDNC